MSEEAKKPAARRAPAGIDEQLRRAIRDAIEDGTSASALAREAGIAPPIVTRFLSGKRDLHLETAAAIAGVLGLKLVESGRPGRRR